MSRFTGKRVLITGAASGIGASTCRRFLDEGADVVAVDRLPITPSTFEGADALAASIQLDLARLVPDDVFDRAGDVDVLVNAAGVLHRHVVEDHPLEPWDHTLRVNVVAPFRLSSLFVQQLMARGTGGAIVNVCSIESFIAIPGHAAYTASKSAVLMMTRAFALELADKGIRVNGIAPGVTETGMNEVLRKDPERSAQLVERIPMRRFGKPADQAAAIAFLASDDAAYITGAVVPVDGGWLTQ